METADGQRQFTFKQVSVSLSKEQNVGCYTCYMLGLIESN